MPLTRAQAENFVAEFFRDHRLPPPAIRLRRRGLPAITLRARRCLNLPATITRDALADQVAARLCREIIRRTWLERQKMKRPRLARHFGEWKIYVRGVVVKQFGKGDGLK